MSQSIENRIDLLGYCNVKENGKICGYPMPCYYHDHDKWEKKKLREDVQKKMLLMNSLRNSYPGCGLIH